MYTPCVKMFQILKKQVYTFFGTRMCQKQMSHQKQYTPCVIPKRSPECLFTARDDCHSSSRKITASDSCLSFFSFACHWMPYPHVALPKMPSKVPRSTSRSPLGQQSTKRRVQMHPSQRDDRNGSPHETARGPGRGKRKRITRQMRKGCLFATFCTCAEKPPQHVEHSHVQTIMLLSWTIPLLCFQLSMSE